MCEVARLVAISCAGLGIEQSRPGPWRRVRGGYRACTLSGALQKGGVGWGEAGDWKYACLKCQNSNGGKVAPVRRITGATPGTTVGP